MRVILSWGTEGDRGSLILSGLAVFWFNIASSQATMPMKLQVHVYFATLIFVEHIVCPLKHLLKVVHIETNETPKLVRLDQSLLVWVDKQKISVLIYCKVSFT